MDRSATTIRNDRFPDTALPNPANRFISQTADQFEYLRHMNGQMPVGIGVTVLFSSLATWLLWQHAPDYLLIPWLAFIALAAGIHLLLLHRFTRDRSHAGLHAGQSQYNIFLCTVNALAWGVGNLMFLHYLELPQQLLMLTITALYAVIYIPVLASLFVGYVSFLTALTVPLLIWMVFYPLAHTLAELGAVLFSYILLLYSAHRYSSVLSDSFKQTAGFSHSNQLLQEQSEKIKIDNIQLRRSLLERQQQMEELSKETGQALITLDSISEGVISTDINGLITYINPVAEVYTGWEKKQSIMTEVSQVFRIIDDTYREELPNPVTKCISTADTVLSGDHALLVRLDGIEYAIEYTATPVLRDGKESTGAVLVFRDVTEKRNLASNLDWQASHDPLTNLINRREFEQRLDKIISKHDAAAERQHALCFIDLDHFKIINDSCGHLAGDSLLKKLSEKLRRSSRETDTVARLGGDEFGVILYGCNLDKATLIAESFRQKVEETSFSWKGKRFRVGVSIGIVPINDLTGGVTEAMQMADMACYAAKESGRNQIHVYDINDQAILEHRGEVRWAESIQSALEQESLMLLMQPLMKAAPSADESIGEMLLRLRLDEGTLVLPERFMSAACRYHLMPGLDRWTVKACFELLSYGHPALSGITQISINLSCQSVLDDRFMGQIFSLLRDYRIDAQKICFEIEESCLISDIKGTERFISTMKEKGFRFALDNFKGGLKTLYDISRMGVEYIKFDGCLSGKDERRSVEYIAIDAMNGICHQLGLQTVAKFIASREDLDAMLKIGVDYIQGYAVSRPAPLDQQINSEPEAIDGESCGGSVPELSEQTG